MSSSDAAAAAERINQGEKAWILLIWIMKYQHNIIEQLFNDLEQRFVKLKKEYSLQQAEHENAIKVHQAQLKECTELREKVCELEKEKATWSIDSIEDKKKLKQLETRLAGVQHVDAERLAELDADDHHADDDCALWRVLSDGNAVCQYGFFGDL